DFNIPLCSKARSRQRWLSSVSLGLTRMSHLVVRIVLAASLLGIVANAQSQLSAPQASERAAQLANSECQRRFERSPFEGSAAAARFVDGRWHWKASAGLGHGDVVADIS